MSRTNSGSVAYASGSLGPKVCLRSGGQRSSDRMPFISGRLLETASHYLLKKASSVIIIGKPPGTAIFSLFHFMAHKLITKILQHTKKNSVLPI